MIIYCVIHILLCVHITPRSKNEINKNTRSSKKRGRGSIEFSTIWYSRRPLNAGVYTHTTEIYLLFFFCNGLISYISISSCRQARDCTTYGRREPSRDARRRHQNCVRSTYTPCTAATGAKPRRENKAETKTGLFFGHTRGGPFYSRARRDLRRCRSVVGSRSRPRVVGRTRSHARARVYTRTRWKNR